MLRKVREENIVGEKVSAVATEMFRTATETKAINTDLANVSWEILDCISLNRRMSE